MNWIFIYPLWLCPFKLLAQVNCDDVRSLAPGEVGLREVSGEWRSLSGRPKSLSVIFANMSKGKYEKRLQPLTQLMSQHIYYRNLSTKNL